MKKVKILIEKEIEKANKENDSSYLIELVEVKEFIETLEFMKVPKKPPLNYKLSASDLQVPF